MTAEYSDKRWRRKLHDILCRYLENINEYFPRAKFFDKDYKKFVVDKTTERIKDAFNKTVIERSKSKEKYSEKKHPRGYDQMFSHLNRIEDCTCSYLRTLQTTLNEVFKREFMQASKRFVSDTFDLFVADIKFNIKSGDATPCETGATTSEKKKFEISSAANASCKSRTQATEHENGTVYKRKSDTETSHNGPMKAAKMHNMVTATQSNEAKPSNVTLAKTTKHSNVPGSVTIVETNNTSKAVNSQTAHHQARKISEILRTVNHLNHGPSVPRMSKTAPTIGVIKPKSQSSQLKSSGNSKHSQFANTSANNTAVGVSPAVTMKPKTSQKTPHKRQSENVRAVPIRHVAGSLAYYCLYCKNVGPFNEQNDVYRHWKSEHSQNTSQLHRFVAAEVVICDVCKKPGTWPEVVHHHLQKHPGEQLTASSGIDHDRCALCMYNGNERNSHFKQKHAEAIKWPWNELFVSPENLDKLFSSHECGNKVVHFKCCRQNIMKPECLLNHLKQHRRTCPSCNASGTKDVEEMVTHVKNVHGNTLDDFFSNLKKVSKQQLLQSNFVLQNGLVLAYGDLVTKYDPIPIIWKLLDEWITTLKCVHIDDSQNKHLIKLVVPYVHGEDVKLILTNLCEELGINQAKRGFLKIQRINSSRSIDITCKNVYIKDLVKKCETGKEIFAHSGSESVYDMRSRVPIIFEY